MPTPGKNFPGQKGFPTPNSTPDDTIRRIFIVPNSEEWLGLLEGAAQVLLEEWRYYDWGALTPSETVAAFNDVVLASYTNLCQCQLPGGGNVIRLNPTNGHLEELGPDGAWVDPTGDYTVPAITPREGGTPQDQRCLAAANAANVLQILYESITDSIASSLDTAEAYTALVEAFTLAVGWEFAPIAFALAAFFLVVFATIYAVVKVIGADLWDSTFTDTLKCALFECATDEGAGVITFDWLCTQDKLAATPVALTEAQVRLYLQLEFIVQVIGGVDGLNQAGATTAITEADCSACEPANCFGWTFGPPDSRQGWEICGFGAWNPGGWFEQQCSGGSGSTSSVNLATTTTDNANALSVYRIEIDTEVVGLNAAWLVYASDNAIPCTGSTVLAGSGTVVPGVQTIVLDIADTDFMSMQIVIDTAGGCGFGDVKVFGARVYSHDLAHAGLVSNC